ncbi:MAG TPA: hypothetical protein VJN48_10675, partial [Terriglobales bacterium]|jgi:hypothetical protein|nr:hypothetical protein [Terriglobales bacterium]
MAGDERVTDKWVSDRASAKQKTVLKQKSGRGWKLRGAAKLCKTLCKIGEYFPWVATTKGGSVDCTSN